MRRNKNRDSLERPPFHVLYADQGLDNIFHHLVLKALGANRQIFPVWSSHEEEIRLLWTQTHFHCAFLVLNNVIVPHSRNPEERIRSVLALIRWLRDRSSATIIALSGWVLPGIEEEALNDGADRFFPLPFPPAEVLDLLRKRFGEPSMNAPGQCPAKSIYSSPQSEENHYDYPASWSILRRTLAHLFNFPEGSLNDLWSAFEGEIWADIELSQSEWDKLQAMAIYKEDPLSSLLALTLGYLIDLGIESESFSRILNAFEKKVQCLGDFQLVTPDAGLFSNVPIIETSEVCEIGIFRLDSFDIHKKFIDLAKSIGVEVFGDLANISCTRYLFMS